MAALAKEKEDQEKKEEQRYSPLLEDNFGHFGRLRRYESNVLIQFQTTLILLFEFPYNISQYSQ